MSDCLERTKTKEPQRADADRPTDQPTDLESYPKKWMALWPSVVPSTAPSFPEVPRRGAKRFFDRNARRTVLAGWLARSHPPLLVPRSVNFFLQQRSSLLGRPSVRMTTLITTMTLSTGTDIVVRYFLTNSPLTFLHTTRVFPTLTVSFFLAVCCWDEARRGEKRAI